MSYKAEIRSLTLIFILTFIITGCASNLRRELEVDYYLEEQEYNEALAQLQENEKKFGDKNRLLYLLNAGAISHYAGQYDTSNTYFEEAYMLAEDLYTKSISREAMAKVSPNMRPYYGEDYEKVMINTFMALNYLQLGNLEDAHVEARRIDAVLSLLTQKYENENKYKNDAFGRYLAGIIEELDNEPNDALISYMQAYQAYRDYQEMFSFPVPGQIKKDILRLCRLLDFDQKYRSYLEEFGEEFDEREITGKRGDTGEIIFIFMTGLAPFKREMNTRFTAVGSDGKTHTFQVQIPQLIERPSMIKEVWVTCGNATNLSSTAEIVQHMGKIAEKNMEDKKPMMLLGAWTRALAKFIATEKAKDKMEGDSFWGNLLKGAITDALAEEMTKADIRCWRTIPEKIMLYRKRVPPGSYKFLIKYLGGDGNGVIARVEEKVEVYRGQTTILYFNELI
jgi:hypothetical protein